LEEMTNTSDSVANGSEVNALWDGGLREREFRNEVERSDALASAVIAAALGFERSGCNGCKAERKREGR
jgi:hypothetical protein